jgi:hypothetical protein
VWGMVLILFMVIGQIVFYDLKGYADPFTAIGTLIQAAFGAWDMTPFSIGKKYSCSDGSLTAINDCYNANRTVTDSYLGQIYMLLFLVLNIVVIINLVIAILATTYNEYSEY